LPAALNFNRRGLAPTDRQRQSHRDFPRRAREKYFIKDTGKITCAILTMGHPDNFKTMKTNIIIKLTTALCGIVLTPLNVSATIGGAPGVNISI
jgi:hypothetical protein